MKKQTPYYSTLSELARFAVGCEEDAATQPIEEIEENLTRQGIDVADLKATTLRRIKRLKNRMQANEAGLRIVTTKRESLTVVEMYQRLQQEGHPIAARGNDALADEDIETAYRLTRSEEEDGS
jgi:hypothetical protein